MDSNLKEYIEELQNEVPRIDAAVKNLITLLVGSKNFEIKDALTMGKALLNAVQQTSLLDIDEFCSKYPQRDNQSGLDRLTEVCRYKTVFGLRNLVLDTKAKVSKLFGRKYLIWTKIWPDILSHTQNSLKSNATLMEEDVNLSFRALKIPLLFVVMKRKMTTLI